MKRKTFDNYDYEEGEALHVRRKRKFDRKQIKYFSIPRTPPPGISISGLPKRTEGVRSKKLCKSRAHRRGVKICQKIRQQRKRNHKKELII